MSDKIVRHMGQKLVVKRGSYRNGVPALELVFAETDHEAGNMEGEPWCVASVNLPEAACKLVKGQTFIKNWSENEGVLEALQEAGVVGPTLFEVQTGFVKAQAVQILD